MADDDTGDPDASMHVYPHNDIRPHSLNGGPCLCNPWIEIVKGGDGVTRTVYCHHAFRQHGGDRIWHYAN